MVSLWANLQCILHKQTNQNQGRKKMINNRRFTYNIKSNDRRCIVWLSILCCSERPHFFRKFCMIYIFIRLLTENIPHSQRIRESLEYSAQLFIYSLIRTWCIWEYMYDYCHKYRMCYDVHPVRCRYNTTLISFIGMCSTSRCSTLRLLLLTFIVRSKWKMCSIQK